MTTTTIQTTETGKAIRETLRQYIASYRSDKVDGALFADLESQRTFFGRKIGDTKSALIEALKNAGKQLCRVKSLQAAGGGYRGYQVFEWTGQTNGQVCMVDIVSGRKTWEDNSRFEKSFTVI